MKGPRWRRVSSPRNSTSTASLKDLDWHKWWYMDDLFWPIYLHVPHKDGETVHRVYPRHPKSPKVKVGLGMRKGVLYWILP